MHRSEEQQAATEKARQYARDVLRGMTDAVLTVSYDWQITAVTENGARALRRKADGLVGRQLWRSLPELGENFEQEVRRSAAGQLPLYFEEHIGCWDAWLQFRTLPLADSLAIYIVDTTATHRERHVRDELMRRIKHDAAEWQHLFDTIDAPILVLDRNGSILRLNEAARRVTGREYQNLIGMNVVTLGDNELWRASAALAASVCNDGKAAEISAFDESTGRSWEIHGTYFPQVGGTAFERIASCGMLEPRVIVQARDTTEVIALEYSLRMNEKLSTIGMVTAGVAHEVRNPLFSISSLVDALESSFPERSELHPYLQRLRQQVVRMGDLMSDLLEYGRSSSFDQLKGPLLPVIENAVTSCGALAQRTEVTVCVTPYDSPEVNMDAARLELVFRNLVENAIQHSPAGTKVEITLKSVEIARNRHIECAVRDAGPGFAESDLPHVFEPFYTRRKGGTGLGLSIVQRVVLEHGGSVHASNAPDGGACVTVRLPINCNARKTRKVVPYAAA